MLGWNVLKRLIVIVALIVCVASVLGGSMYWKDRIDRTAKLSSQESTAAVSVDDTSGTMSDKAVDKLPGSLKKVVRQAQKDGRLVQLTLVGGGNVRGLAPLLQERLNQAFGELFFKVTPIDVGHVTSLEFNRTKAKELFKNIDKKPDAVIFFPLLYNDDHQVSTDDSETVTSMFEEKVKLAYPKVAFFVTLPNYSSNEPYMNERIDDLALSLRKKKLDSIDYLSKWPKGSKRSRVVEKDGHTMNESGRQLWIDAVADQWHLKKD
jgi:hypothetical protein